MKTHVNNAQKSNDRTHRVSLFSILVIASVLVFTIAEIYGQNTYSEDTIVFSENLYPDSDNNAVTRFATKKSEDTKVEINLNYISSLEACCSTPYKQGLEFEKIEKSLIPDDMLKYWNILAEFNSIEETVLTDEEVSLPFAYPVLKSNNVKHYYDTFGYLQEMYEQKNTEIFNELEMERKLKNYLEVETEDEMELEEWMLDETNFGSYLHIEEALEVEDWMLDERVFSPNPSIIEETDAPLELEEWMTAESVWK